MTSANSSEAGWVEVTHPLPDAMRILAECVHGSAQALQGASIAVTARGTLLLNQRAWLLCGPLLRALPDLQVARSGVDATMATRFLLGEANSPHR